MAASSSSPSSLSYVVSAKRATVVSHVVTCTLTGDDDINVVMAKTNRLEIFLVTVNGLKPVAEVPIFGRIATLNVIRRKNETRDSLVLMTCKLNLAIVSWDGETNELRTRASGSVAERVGRLSDSGIITTVHSASALIAVRIYDGSIKVVEWEDGKDLRAFSVRLEDMTILDIQFLNSSTSDTTPRLLYIYEDPRGRHLKTLELLTAEKDVKPIANQSSIESEAFIIIPLPSPCGGAIILGQETITLYREDNTYLSVSPPQLDHAQFTCFTRVDNDGHRFLLADLSGNLFMLLLEMSNNDSGAKTVSDLKLEYLGETSIAECLVYLDNGVVFIGSKFGDSQLIRLHAEPQGEQNSFVSVLDTFANLGPIRDMVVVEADGMSHLITCSGGFKDGSLRVIRNGIGVEELASVDLPGVKGLFSLRIDSDLDNYLVVSLSNETHILHVTGEELEDTQLSGFETEEMTLWTGTTIGGMILQATPTGIRVVKGSTEVPVVWRQPKELASLSAVAVNQQTGQVLAAAAAHLFYLEVTDGDIVMKKHVELEHEIACIDISSINDGQKSELAAIGLWTEMCAVLLSIPDLKEMHREKLGSEIVPRSVEICRMDHVVYLLAAMGDGALVYFTLDTTDGVLREPKRATLGTQPTLLRRFRSRGVDNIFACSDRPAVLFSSAGKLLFSNVNLKLVTQMTTLNAECYPESLVLTDGEALLICRIDDIQKLHMRSVPLGENAIRIAHQPETKTLALLTSREEKSQRLGASRLATATSSSRPSNTAAAASASTDSYDGEVHNVVILEQNTFEILHSHELRLNEHALSLVAATLANDPTPYFIVGTAVILPDEAEPKQGRVLIFEAGSGEQRTQLRLIHEKELKGAAYSLAVLNGKLVVAVNSSVRLLEWTAEKELRLECSHFNYVTALYVKTKGDLLLVGDLMRSLCLLSYKPMESVFEEIARDTRGQWMSACEIIDADRCMGAEASFNLFTVEREANAQTTEERVKLHDDGAFYLGELVNVFRRGSLVSSRTETSLPLCNSILFGTVDGSIGQVIQVSSEPFNKFLKEVEKSVAASTTNCTRVEHSAYRAFHSERHAEPKTGFVDGDLVESLMDMPRDKAHSILADISLPAGVDVEKDPEHALKLIEELSRLH